MRFLENYMQGIPWWKRIAITLMALMIFIVGLFLFGHMMSMLIDDLTGSDKPSVIRGTPKPKGIELVEISTKCYSYAWPERMGYRRVPEDRRAELAFKKSQGIVNIMPVPTLWCVDLGSCEGQPQGCKHTTAKLTEDWFIELKLPARRVKP